MRKCFVCDRPAFECSRSRRHPLSEVIEHINNEAEKYFDSLCWKTASTAARAMMTEVLVTPKPGLVDRLNSGAHSDMDIFTFTDSTTALVKPFTTLHRLVLTLRILPWKQIFLPCLLL